MTGILRTAEGMGSLHVGQMLGFNRDGLTCELCVIEKAKP